MVAGRSTPFTSCAFNSRLQAGVGMIGRPLLSSAGSVGGNGKKLSYSTPPPPAPRLHHEHEQQQDCTP